MKMLVNFVENWIFKLPYITNSEVKIKMEEICLPPYGYKFFVKRILSPED